MAQKIRTVSVYLRNEIWLMANVNPPNPFQANNNISKGNQGAKRRVAYDALWKEALETGGADFVAKLIEHRDCEDRNVSVRACDVFFKYARPPENIIVPDQSKEIALQVVDKYGLSSDQYKAVKEAGLKAQHEEIQRILSEKDSSGSNTVADLESENATS